MKISVLLAVHNGMPYLPQAIESVLNQTHADFELLIGCNGFMDDDTIALCEKYEQADARIKMWLVKEKGKAKMLNQMLAHATGAYVAIQDADDVWTPSKLQMQVEQLQRKPVDVLGTWFTIIDHSGTPLRDVQPAIENTEIQAFMLAGNNQIGNCTALIRTQVLKDLAQAWFPQWEGVEDYDLWLRLIKQGCTFFNIPSHLAMHRVHVKSHFNTQTFDIKKLLAQHGY